jgi:phosphonate transport system substrate-binding protein
VSELIFAAAAHSESTQRAVHDFCAWLSAGTGLVLTPRLLRSYAELVESVLSGAADLAWAPPLVAVELENKKRVFALATVTRSMRSAYHSALFSLSKAPFRRPEDLRDVTVAWVSRESASGYFVPRWHLSSIGLSLERCFAREVFYESHQAVVRAVLDGEADVGATHVSLEPVSGQLARAPWLAEGASPSAVRVLLLVGPIPGDVIVAGAQIALATRQRLTAALLSLHNQQFSGAFDAARFEPVPDGHLRLLKGLHTHAGLQGTHRE